MSEPLVSVIVPIYNTEEYLGECVESIIHQTYENLEIIMINDGSTDKCANICDAYALMDSRIKVIHKKNGGQSSARQTGIATSQGEYLMFVDSDDWIDVETIEKCVAVAKQNNSECVLFSYIKEYANRSIPNYLFETDFNYNKKETEEKIHRRLIGYRKEELQYPEKIDNLSTICIKLYKRETALRGRIISLNEIGTSEDTIFNIYALEGCRNISYINQCFYHYRRTNPQATTMRYKPELYQKWGRLYQIFEEYICLSKNETVYWESFLNRVACGMIGLGLNEANAQHSIYQKSKNLKEILEDPLYKKAFQQLDYTYCSIKWKVFFYLCRKRQTLILAAMLELINYIRINCQ